MLHRLSVVCLSRLYSKAVLSRYALCFNAERRFQLMQCVDHACNPSSVLDETSRLAQVMSFQILIDSIPNPKLERCTPNVAAAPF